MSGINTVILSGNLSKDPELRYTPKGSAICGFSVATNREWKTESGEKREEVSFIDCVCFGASGENVSKFFAKGRPILVEGRLKQETWDDKQTGAKRYAVKVVVDRWHFIGGKKDDVAQPKAKISREDLPPGTKPAATDPPEGDDVPF